MANQRLTSNELLAAARGAVIRVETRGWQPTDVVPVPDGRLRWEAMATWQNGAAYKLAPGQHRVAWAMGAYDFASRLTGAVVATGCELWRLTREHVHGCPDDAAKVDPPGVPDEQDVDDDSFDDHDDIPF